MFTALNSPFANIYQTEFETVWNKFTDSIGGSSEFLEPLKLYLLKQDQILTFSLAKYLETPHIIAVWLDLLYKYAYLNQNINLLDEVNQQFFESNYPDFPSNQKIEFRFSRTYSLAQLQLMSTWIWQTHDNILFKFPTFQWFLNLSFWSEYLQTETKILEAYFKDKVILGDVLESLGSGIGMIQIGFPILVGFTLISEQSVAIKPALSDWKDLQIILKQFATIYDLKIDKRNTVQSFLYFQTLSLKEREAWWSKTENERKKEASTDLETKQALENIIIQYTDNVKNDLDKLKLSHEYKDFLFELGAWIFEINKN